LLTAHRNNRGGDDEGRFRAWGMRQGRIVVVASNW
jgi:hypothetical protein